MKQKHIYNLAALLLASSAAFISCSDNDLDGPQTDGDRGASVVFNIKDIQQDNIAKVAAATRAGISPTLLYTPGLTQEDLAPRRLEAVSSDGLDACLIETTVEGINPTKPDPSTRAKVETSIEHDFTSLGYRGETAGTISDKPEWFYSKKTKKNGELYETHFWSWGKPYGRFYAIYPEATAANKITLSPATHQGTPYLDFEVEEEVKDQHDLMTACSGEVHYSIKNTAPTTNLEFRHALTAVKFAVGQNLSWNKAIDRVELRGAMSKGKYILSDQLDGTGAQWDATSLSVPKNFKLRINAPGVSTSEDPNTLIIGKSTDNFTFYMIPQELTGKNIKAYFHFTDGSALTIPLTGRWKAGTTKTYKLSHKNSNWSYVLTATPTITANYDQTQTTTYSITSYRESGGTKKPVKWEVVGYDADGDGNFTMGEKPAWVTSLSKENGDGGTVAETGTATVTKDVTDLLAKRNKDMKEATPRGTSSNYYDLSTHKLDGTVIPRSTANCYVISAPGFYKIPLVYGNAIKNGNKNESSYKTSNTGTYILQNFKDHLGNDINDPWIEKTNSGANSGVDGAKIVWADEADLVTDYTIEHDGNDAYIQFEVTKDDIKTGNVVLAATKNGVVVWSWHLWFTAPDVLNTITCTNFQNTQYNISKETLGWKYTTWKGSSFFKPREVKVKVMQTIANNSTKQEAIFTIIQTNGVTPIVGHHTLYQWGRKDALPGTDNIIQGSYSFDSQVGGRSVSYAIQHPENMFNAIGSGPFYTDWNNPYYSNLWNITNNLNNMVKSVYDPCPAGFQVPHPFTFSFFTKNGSTGGPINATGSWNFGWNFNNKVTDPDATIYCPGGGYRVNAPGSPLTLMGLSGDYWLSNKVNGIANNVGFSAGGITTVGIFSCCWAAGVRPVADN